MIGIIGYYQNFLLLFKPENIVYDNHNILIIEVGDLVKEKLEKILNKKAMRYRGFIHLIDSNFLILEEFKNKK